MKKYKLVGFIAVLLGLVLFLFLISNNTHDATIQAEKGQWKIVIIDEETEQIIKNARVVVTQLDKSFEISEEDNIISLPERPTANNLKSQYPYGYTIITYSKGYLPRIDHNIYMGKEGATDLVIALKKPEPYSNEAYTEFFHDSSQAATVDMLGYYKIGE